jgi:hypothetical protein
MRDDLPPSRLGVNDVVVPSIDDFVPGPKERSICEVLSECSAERAWRLWVDAGIEFWRLWRGRGGRGRNAHRLGEFGKLTPNGEQFLLLGDASSARLSHRFFERRLSREQLKKFVD